MIQRSIKFALFALPLIVLGCQGKPSVSPVGSGGGGRRAAAGPEATATPQPSSESGASEAQIVSKLLRSDDAEVRRWAAQRLLNHPELALEVVPAMGEALSDPDGEVRYWVASTLSQVGPPAASVIPALTKCAQVDPMWAVRAECIKAVARAAPTGEAAMPAILIGLADEDAQVQSRSAFALGQVERWEPDSVPALAKLLEDDRTYVRARAAESLGRVGPPAKSAVPALERLTQDTDAHVRLASSDALSKIRGEGG